MCTDPLISDWKIADLLFYVTTAMQLSGNINRKLIYSQIKSTAYVGSKLIIGVHLMFCCIYNLAS